MNDPISWDPTLVKKFSSSNHFKLLNQLRSEVKKYPLNNKKNLKADQTIKKIQDLKNKTNDENIHNTKISKYPSKKNDNNTKQSNVSFNNSKNFSIYNQATDSTISRQSEHISSDQYSINDDSSSITFKERLNQIDMK
tara:strand:- start:532 stop:945 length:414 start_codon:yes stop_codon:yes gene_type:complete